MTQDLPNFESRGNEPVRSASRELPAKPPLVDHWEPVAPTVVSAPHAMSTAHRIALQQGWTEPMIPDALSKASTMTPNDPASTSSPPASVPVKISVDPRRTPSPHVTTRQTAVSSPRLTPAPVTAQQNAKPAEDPSSSPSPSTTSGLSNTTPANPEVPGASPSRPTIQSSPARTRANGVFARGQGMPWLFHVHGNDKTGITAMMIEV